jgi:hypothetical protein
MEDTLHTGRLEARTCLERRARPIADAPEPHPLDFDWRFTQETTDLICGLLHKSPSTLAVGAPSIARRLDSLNRPVTLVDRQPIQGAKRHVAAEIGFGMVAPLSSFAAAIVDPPWYPLILRHWVSWAARFVEINGTLIVSLWPDNVRPHGAEEADHVLNWVAEWAEVEVISTTARYERPRFESAAMRVSRNGMLASSPGEGRLLRLRIKNHPKIQELAVSRSRWIRFILDDYQLGILLDSTDSSIGVRQHPAASGWIWPYVSARAPGRDIIGIWSSHNEVGIVGRPDELVPTVRQAVLSSTPSAFEAQLSKCPQLLSWDIPRPPYSRILEWQHP